MKNLNPHSYTLPISNNPVAAGMPLCSDGVFFMEKPRLIQKLNPISSRNGKYIYYYGVFECFCGRLFVSYLSMIKNGSTKSCGCERNKASAKRARSSPPRLTHGMAHARLYYTMSHIKQRCLNPKTPLFKHYGGRGITVCDEWKNDFMSFINWALSNGYKDDLQIDRIDVNGNYEPSNCRWVTPSINMQNTRLLRSANTSGYRGVGFQKNKWVARIMDNKKSVYLGIFKTKEDAAQAYNDYVIANKTAHPLNIIP